MWTPHYNGKAIHTILIPGDLNWVQHWVSRFGLFTFLNVKVDSLRISGFTQQELTMLLRSSVQIYEADNIAHYLPETDGASSSLILVFKEDCFICELSRSIIRFLESSSIWKRRNSLSTSFVSQSHILLNSQKRGKLTRVWPPFKFFFAVVF